MNDVVKINNGLLKYVNYSHKNFHQICSKDPYTQSWYFLLFGVNTKFYESMKLLIFPILGNKKHKFYVFGPV